MKLLLLRLSVLEEQITLLLLRLLALEEQITAFFATGVTQKAMFVSLHQKARRDFDLTFNTHTTDMHQHPAL